METLIRIKCDKHGGTLCGLDTHGHIVHAVGRLFCDSPTFTVIEERRFVNRETANVTLLSVKERS